MAVVYILYSASINSFYVGSCEDFDSRLSQHLNGDFKKAFTKRAKDWQKFLLLENLEYAQSRQIEAHIKKMKSTKYIANLKMYEEMRQKLIERFKTGSSR